ncbi:protein transport protein Sec31B isoform X1 [Microcaecilia unicolor]|uniref:Protein transport protein Sec31B isoform X1 n=2 Tax=Microcaecilia unicolor TaxID=1415580 RepID=A0A6P7Y8G0_9AMPH|nr:protein transport protein Sec31B isoform X1 [Microcaecilia unicolor]XP_030059375.1 protein transport protein Sec31B isoform X1 [Microcaecilia unicolor]XP_030059376.1 protein transport protein Sec31B isoform X1 [Microcaecilia unicolor]XP_030059377.1 protein transport protein Sec31B isoform X1 [Microcaecilia unicolor]XP_030059378.1 protein transport protein Sec31B isoform X1 [Microcaecilia unicolor]XP_030059379.1 protein transport protein Sec31B isoform X1 [Microcaecilia unicolor]XP_03005938
MKLKEIERAAVQVWSPASQHPLYLATGTSAQQLDASFSTSAALEIFEVDFGDPFLDTRHRGILSSASRFHKLIWGSFGVGPPDFSGVIVGGGDNGVITLYNASQILTSGKEPVIGQSQKHTGPVRALDLNPFQSNLLASGANDSEIYIWDLNNFSVPMTPGAKSQPPEDISVVSWNSQVQHILSSAHTSGKAVLWDLRKNEPIIKIGDHSNKMHCSGMMWHPEVATQLVLSSEDDRMPVIQLWDLRFATSPLRVLENHTRGVLSVSWCRADPELLLSSAKDNRILCWNPCSGEVVYELPTRSQWCFDVQWCPRYPSVFSAASFDGWINVYSIMGGSLDSQQQSQCDKISASFNNLDPFGTGQPLPSLQVPQKVQATVISPVKKPPRWMCRPVGVSFAFGGKLITFGYSKSKPQELSQFQVFISQVTTEKDLLARSRELQTALASGNLLPYCQRKVENSELQSEKNIWNFLKVNFERDARIKFLKLLGYSKEQLNMKISSLLGDNTLDKDVSLEAGDLGHHIPSMSGQGSGCYPGLISSSEFFSCLSQNTAKFEIPITTDTDGLISQALLIGDFEGAVELCLNGGRFADAIILAIAGGEKLLAQTQQRYFAKQKNRITSLLSSVVQHKWKEIVLSCDLVNWKEALAVLLTYSKLDEYAKFCDILGARLESEDDGRMSSYACLCYITSRNVEKLVACWSKIHKMTYPLSLQDFIEKVMVLGKSIEFLKGTASLAHGPLFAEKLTQYVSLLASQGNLAVAMSFLPDNSEELLICQLRDRLFHAQGETVVGQQAPVFPYPCASIAASGHVSPVAKTSTVPQGTAQNMDPKQDLYQPTVNTPVPSLPLVPPLFTPQPLPASLCPPPGISLSTTGTARAAALPPPPAYVQHSATAAMSVFPQPFRPPQGPLPGPAAFPPTSSVPSGPPGSPSPLGPFTLGPRFPAASVPSPSHITAHTASHSFPIPGQPSKPTSLTTMQSPYSYPAGISYSPGGPGAQTFNPLAPANLPPPPTAGTPEVWGKPPPIRGVLQKKKMLDQHMPPVPITVPVMNLPTQPEILLPQLAINQDSSLVPPGAPKELLQMPVERIEKKALPAEHHLLKKTLEELVQRCSVAATDPKTKRNWRMRHRDLNTCMTSSRATLSPSHSGWTP